MNRAEKAHLNISKNDEEKKYILPSEEQKTKEI